MSVLQMLSPATLRDDSLVTPMLDLFELSDRGNRADRGQSWIETPADRIEQLGRITVPCRVISFSDDIVTPPHLAAEVAEAIPDCDLIEIGDAGHLGFLEQPDEVNRAIVEFFDKHPTTGGSTGVTVPRASA
jgi:pimeloyl-ACP methyl ester carboxylesterase